MSKGKKDQNATTPSMKNDGFIVEMFSSYQGEGGAVEGSCLGRRQIFIRFAGCNLNCLWCDTTQSRNPTYPECRIESVPGTWHFIKYKNPVRVEFIIERVSSLSTKDLHSVSLTGGEPTYQEEFFYHIVNWLYNVNIPIFLETNGNFPERIEKIASHISYACVDIKDRSAMNKKTCDWENLLAREFKSITILKKHQVKVFAKVVVTEKTSLEDIRMYADKLREIAVPIVVQPVTPGGGIKAIPAPMLFKITEAIAEVLPNNLFGISIQSHKILKLL